MSSFGCYCLEKSPIGIGSLEESPRTGKDMINDQPTQYPLLIVATGGRVRSIDRRTGERQWEVAVVESSHPLGAHVHQAIELIVREDVVLAAAYASKQLFCIDYRTGAVIGCVDLGTIGRKTLLIDGDQIFVGRGREVRCYDLRGQLLWQDSGQDGASGVVSLGFPGNVRQADQGD